jgi:hypothetical protein
VFLLLGVAHVIPFIVCVACAKLDCMMGLRFVPFTWLIVALKNDKLTSVKQQKQHKEPSDKRAK